MDYKSPNFKDFKKIINYFKWITRIQTQKFSAFPNFQEDNKNPIFKKTLKDYKNPIFKVLKDYNNPFSKVLKHYENPIFKKF